MSEIENGRLGLYEIEHSKRNNLMTLGFKGLNFIFIAAEHSAGTLQLSHSLFLCLYYRQMSAQIISAFLRQLSLLCLHLVFCILNKQTNKQTNKNTNLLNISFN